MNQKEILKIFEKDIASHEMTILLDQEGYRHLQCKRPDTNCYAFSIVTYPGYLVISGDMGCSVFSRSKDMFEFFRERPNKDLSLQINPQYWAEKLQANDGEKREFDRDSFLQLINEKVQEHIDEHREEEDDECEWAGPLRVEVEEAFAHVSSMEEAIGEMGDFESNEETHSLTFTDPWEYSRSMEEWNFHLIWRMYAIAWAIRQYDCKKQTEIRCFVCGKGPLLVGSNDEGVHVCSHECSVAHFVQEKKIPT